MNTIARVGKAALKTLFSKMNVFGELEIDIDSKTVTYPKLPDKKEIVIEKEGPEMEEGGYKAYQGITKGRTKRQERCKVFTWSMIIGLVEIPLEQFKPENTLFGMIATTHLPIKSFGHNMLSKTPTHVVVAKNRKWLDVDDTDGPTLGKVLAEGESETITIYAIEKVWQQMIWDGIAVREYHKRIQ